METIGSALRSVKIWLALDSMSFQGSPVSSFRDPVDAVLNGIGANGFGKDHAYSVRGAVQAVPGRNTVAPTIAGG